MKQRILISFGIVLVLAGLILGFRPFMNWVNELGLKTGPTMHFKTDSSVNRSKLIKGEPNNIDLPSVNINIPVVDGFYNSKSKAWTLSLDKAQYATITPPPNNNSGNTFIYGHNRWEVFYKLPKIQLGDEAIVTTTNNHKFIYRLSNIRTTKPDDTSLFTYRGAPELTLQTCTGLWYQNRTLFTFQLVEVS